MCLTRKGFYSLVTALCLAGWVWLLSQFLLHKQDVAFTLCPLKNLTGVPCTTCGTTRSVVAFFHGEFTEALYCNPLGIIAAVGLIIAPLWLSYDFVQHKKTFYGAYVAFENILKRPVVYVPLITLLLCNWAWNIYKGL